MTRNVVLIELKPGADRAAVADFEDERADRGHESDAEHNRLRGLLAAHTERVARVQFELPG